MEEVAPRRMWEQTTLRRTHKEVGGKAQRLPRNRDGQECAKEKNYPIGFNIMLVKGSLARTGLRRNLSYLSAMQAHKAT